MQLFGDRAPLQTVRLGLAALALMLPWLFGLTYGPATNIMPLLFACGAAGVFILFSPQLALPWGSRIGLLALPALLVLHSFLVPTPWPQGAAATVLALGLFYLLARGSHAWYSQGREGHAAARYLTLAIALAAVLSSAIALAQYFQIAAGYSPWIHPGNASRVFANLRQPNQLATLTAMGFGIVVCINLPKPWASKERGLQALTLSSLAYAVQFVVLALLAFAAAATLSRTGLLAWVLIYAVCSYWALRGLLPARAWGWATLALLLYAGFSFGLTQGWGAAEATAAAQVDAMERLANTDGGDARLLIWQHVLDAIAAKPWLGWGWGNLGYALLLTPHSQPLTVMVDNAHNLPLQLAAELGLPFALLFVLAVWVWLLRRKPWAEGEPQKQAALLILLPIGLHSLLEYPLWHGPFLIAAAFAFGLLQKPAQREAAEGRGKVAAAFTLIVGLSAIVFAIYAAQDWRSVSQVYLQPDQRDASIVRKNDWLEESLESRVFAPHAAFAQMGITPLTQENAAAELLRAQRLLHFSAEARVLQRAEQAAILLDQQDWAAYYAELLHKNLHPQHVPVAPGANERHLQ